MNENPELNNQADEQFDTTGLILDYLSHWKWFVVSILICCIGAYFYIATRIPVYKIDASIYLSHDNGNTQNAFS
ncbi:MAG: hypothetical protein K2F79_09200, partial [Muribaculaceae bacterium]|nr:hypothetical protein [Muribaculaceae bacterium]